MKKHEYRRVILTLAMSFLIICLTNQLAGLLFSGLGKALIILIFAALILFVVNRTSALYGAVIAAALDQAGLLLKVATQAHFIGQGWIPDAFVDEPPLPSRFQRPPPLSV